MNMEGHDGLMNDMNCLDFCEDLFDHIDDLLEFPAEGDNILLGVGGGDSSGLQAGVWQAPQEDASTSLFSNSHNTSGFPTELPVPDEDIAQLEWLSTFVEDSFSPGSITLPEDLDNKNKNSNTTTDEIHQFQTHSPDSVLDSSSYCSGGRTMPVDPETVVPGRARSKRPRPSTFNHRRLVVFLVSRTSSITDVTPPASSLVAPTSSFTKPTPPFCSPELDSELENFAESNPSTKLPKPSTTEQKKKKKRKLTFSSSSTEQSVLPQPIAVRKCLHCEITKTPQWRAGPLGPKTLCNACGVRFKSGRLFPEYRPAASPTFVPKLHSNSHKKVLEMRVQTSWKIAVDETDELEFLPGTRIWDEYM